MQGTQGGGDEGGEGDRSVAECEKRDGSFIAQFVSLLGFTCLVLHWELGEYPLPLLGTSLPPIRDASPLLSLEPS